MKTPIVTAGLKWPPDIGPAIMIAVKRLKQIATGSAFDTLTAYTRRAVPAHS